LIPRPRLTERLLASSTQKLTLISAPAGFGKTTLVGEMNILCALSLLCESG
jgi:ATP/maltotriose-dependent transcriptional regulator MalT